MNSENEFAEDWTRFPGQIVLKGLNTCRIGRLAEELIDSNPKLLEQDNLPTLAHLLVSDTRSWSVEVGGQVMWATATKSGCSKLSFIQLDGLGGEQESQPSNT